MDSPLHLVVPLQLTDTAIVELTSCCHEIRTLDLSHLSYVTDTALVSVSKQCTNLTSLNLEGASRCCWLTAAKDV